MTITKIFDCMYIVCTVCVFCRIFPFFEGKNVVRNSQKSDVA